MCEKKSGDANYGRTYQQNISRNYEKQRRNMDVEN